MTSWLVAGAAERSPWRWPAAAMSLVVAAAHVPITAQHLEEAPYIGWSFVVLEVVTVVLAVVLLVQDTALVWAVAALVPALAIVAFVVTRTVALPQIGDDVGNWTEPLGFVALASEGLLVLMAIARDTPAWRRSVLARRPLLLFGVLLLAGLMATGWAAGSTAG